MKLPRTLARVLILPLALSAHTAAHALSYEVQPVISSGYPSGFNNQGQVTGYVHYPATEGPAFNFVFDSTSGQRTTLPISLDGSDGYVDINDNGQILTRSGLITNGVLTPHATGVHGVSASLNNAGQYTGSMLTGDGLRPLFASQGQAIALGSVKGYGAAVNNAGMVTGSLEVGTTSEGRSIYHAFVYADGTMTDIGVLAPRAGDNYLEFGDFGAHLGPYSIATAINDQGTVVGRSNGHMFTYQNGVMTVLPALEGATSSLPLSINELGQIVGNSNRGAFLYTDGQTRLLKDLVPAAGDLETSATYTGYKLWWNIHYVYGINDRGQITALAERVEQYGSLVYYEDYAVILNPVAAPVPEPTAMLLASLGVPLAGLIAWRRRAQQDMSA